MAGTGDTSFCSILLPERGERVRPESFVRRSVFVRRSHVRPPPATGPSVPRTTAARAPFGRRGRAPGGGGVGGWGGGGKGDSDGVLGPWGPAPTTRKGSSQR